MNAQVIVSSLAVNKNSNGKIDFHKYNIEVSIEEIENKLTSNKLRYGLTLLSDPKNVRLSAEGTVEISGNEAECVKALEKDENGIPRVLHLIYQELFPTFFMSTKVVGAPCPAYRLSQISAPSEIQESTMDEQLEVEPAAEKTEPKVTTEQPVEKTEPKVTTESIASEKKPEEMSLDELNQLYSKLSSEYQDDPSGDIGEKLQKVSDLIQKRQQEQMFTETS